MKYDWDLSNFITPELFDTYFKDIEESLPKYKDWFQKFNPDMDTKTFNEYVDFDESITIKTDKLYVYAYLLQSLNEKDENAKFLMNKVRDLSVKLDEITGKFSNWIKGKTVEGKSETLDETNAQRLFKSVPNLEYLLNYSRKAAKYTLDEKEERIISKYAVSGAAILSDLKSIIEAEFEYNFNPKDGEPKIIKTAAEMRKYFHSTNAHDREAAYEGIFSRYQENKDKFFLFYQGVVKNWKNSIELRGYSAPISMQNFSNRVSDTVIDTVLEVCTENKDIFQSYFKFKAKKLGLEKLARYDIYAPLGTKDKDVTIEECVQTVDLCFSKFSTKFKDAAASIISAKHLDSHAGENRRGGAYCYSVSPDVVPFVFMNFTGSMKDMFTLAHELGHAVHGVYAAGQNRSAAMHATLPLAETASTFGELLLFDHLLSTTTDPSLKEELIADRIANSYATILRQNYFVLFEIKAHELISQGTKVENLSDLYMELLKNQFGDSVTMAESFRYEWMTIPHIFRSPFYCYSYSFGELLTSALFAMYKEKGPTFVPVIEKLLSYGGSKDPQEALMEVGVDITKKEFWQNSFNLIRGWLKEIE